MVWLVMMRGREKGFGAARSEKYRDREMGEEVGMEGRFVEKREAGSKEWRRREEPHGNEEWK